jgi:hypothetical protein
MVHLTMFAGYEGEFRYDQRFYVTLFGGTELRRPTIARRILMNRDTRDGEQKKRRRPFVLTMFGATEIKVPTLASEFIDLREMLKCGALSLEEWDHAMAELGRMQEGVASFTMFGGFDENLLPSDEEEIDSLAIQCHLGNIDDSARQVLQAGVGQHDSERRAILRRAVYATV